MEASGESELQYNLLASAAPSLSKAGLFNDALETSQLLRDSLLLL